MFLAYRETPEWRIILCGSARYGIVFPAQSPFHLHTSR